jgi:hypothetical protein
MYLKQFYGSNLNYGTYSIKDILKLMMFRYTPWRNLGGEEV